VGDDRMKPKAVCLSSGGLDSTVAAAKALHDGFDIHIIHVLYGQKAERREKRAIEEIAKALGASEVRFVRTDIFQNQTPLTTAEAPIPSGDEVDIKNTTSTPSTWVHCRNLVFGSMAAAYAEAIGAERIFVGFNAEEGRSYPDNRPDFVERFNSLLEKSVASFSRPPKIEAPLVDLFKPEIVKLGSELGAPMELTWSCYLDGDVHCGECEACQHRRFGFLEAGVVDPTEYR
jgi:7-cyano-7-deazaguanine synthase